LGKKNKSDFLSLNDKSDQVEKQNKIVTLLIKDYRRSLNIFISRRAPIYLFLPKPKKKQTNNITPPSEKTSQGFAAIYSAISGNLFLFAECQRSILCLFIFQLSNSLLFEYYYFTLFGGHRFFSCCTNKYRNFSL